MFLLEIIKTRCLKKICVYVKAVVPTLEIRHARRLRIFRMRTRVLDDRLVIRILHNCHKGKIIYELLLRDKYLVITYVFLRLINAFNNIHEMNYVAKLILITDIRITNEYVRIVEIGKKKKRKNDHLLFLD